MEQKYNGQDIFLKYAGFICKIAEGTGDNLLPEDEEEGYVDYFNIEVYKEEYLECPNVIGGGFMMRKTLITDEFYGRDISEVVKEIVKCNGKEDYFDLYLGDSGYEIVEETEFYEEVL